MGNLGFYQDITKVIKKLGGPKVAVPVIIGGSYAALRAVEAGGRKLFKEAKIAINSWNSPVPSNGQVFVVHTDGEDIGGLKLRVGDEYRVLERDGDATLIEVLDDSDNPHFVSGEFLATLSDFPPEEATERV